MRSGSRRRSSVRWSRIRTGNPFIANELLLLSSLSANAGMQERFVNLVLEPMRSSNGVINGLMIHAVEVTEQVRAREKEHEIIRVGENFGSPRLDMGSFETALLGNEVHGT